MSSGWTGGYFHADPDPEEKALHHCDSAAEHHRAARTWVMRLDETLQDILIRWKRMQGYRRSVAARH